MQLRNAAYVSASIVSLRGTIALYLDKFTLLDRGVRNGVMKKQFT